MKTEAEKLAIQEGTTLNQFINVAVAEKIAALKTVAYLEQRAANGSAQDALAILGKAGTDGPVQDRDEVLGFGLR